MDAYVMGPALREVLRRAVADEGWAEDYKTRLTAAIDAQPDGSIPDDRDPDADGDEVDELDLSQTIEYFGIEYLAR